jgi:hypothetical protein
LEVQPVGKSESLRTAASAEALSAALTVEVVEVLGVELEVVLDVPELDEQAAVATASPAVSTTRRLFGRTSTATHLRSENWARG